MTGLPIYLASASPRRRELITRLGRPIIAGTSPVDEDLLTSSYRGPLEELAEFLARAKALAALPAVSGSPEVIVSADTTVILNGRLMGKPTDAQQATNMLRALRGRFHTVTTGIAVAVPGQSHQEPERVTLLSSAVSTRVHMREYSDEEIATYVASGDPYDKAGGYAIQHPSFMPADFIEGCYPSVVGLPLCALAALLDAAQTDAHDPPAAHISVAHDSQPVLVCPWSHRCTPPLYPNPLPPEPQTP